MKLICVNNNHHENILTINKNYKVEIIEKCFNSAYEKFYYRVKANDNHYYYFVTERFMTKKQLRKLKLKKLNQLD